MRRLNAAGLLAVLFLSLACASHQQGSVPADPQSSEFRHDISTGAKPWTHSNFDNNEDTFTFALFSDLTGGEREGIFAVAVEQLNLLRPELILNVGDLIEGGTRDRAQLEREWNSFDQRARGTRAPVFYTGGNHDLTNPEMWAVWDERYGRRYYHFVYKDTLFLVMDTEDNTPEVQWELSRIRDESMVVVKEKGWGAFPATAYGKSTLRQTGQVSAEQAAYFTRVIDTNTEVKHTFVLLHKPAWRRADEENFAAVEDALNGRPYTVFAGHEHDYQHELRRERDYILLGTTGGVQNATKAMAIDHVTLVTVADDGVAIANLRMSGIFDKTGVIPAKGDTLCFEDCK